MKRIRQVPRFNGKVIEKVEGIVPADYTEEDGGAVFTDVRFTFTDGSMYALSVPEPDFEILIENNGETWKWHEEHEEKYNDLRRRRV
jgi:hypothetical protein